MSKKKIRVGLMGVGRGRVLWKYCQECDNAEFVAVCDCWEEGLEKMKERVQDDSVTYYNNFEDFIKHDMDAVFLANYAVEHAPFAIAAMKAGKDVISEVLPVVNMAQAVELIECIEATGKKYFYAENYCYMNGPVEMRKARLNGTLGEIEYGEGEYMHNCESRWPELTRGDENHWRNNMSAFFYCTHSVGPLLHIAGGRPAKVVGVEGPYTAQQARMGAKFAGFGLELITMDNGAVFKSVHGGPSKDSVWYSVYGSKGRMETAREDSLLTEGALLNGVNTLYTNVDAVEGISESNVICTKPASELAQKGASHGHAGSDYVCFWNAFEYLLGNPEADAIDVYEALDMWMVGFFAYLSAMNNSAAEMIPDLRKPEVREQYRNDRRCTIKKEAGDQLLPSYSKGNPMIDPSIYEQAYQQWLLLDDKR